MFTCTWRPGRDASDRGRAGGVRVLFLPVRDQHEWQHATALGDVERADLESPELLRVVHERKLQP